QASPELRRRLLGDHADSDNLLLYVGRLSAEKQIERLRPLLDQLPGARLALVGDGPHRQQLERTFAGTATTFVGYLGGADLAGAYASADAFLFPSSTETLGLVLLEAMAAGCPVVAARCGGIPDIVTDGLNGCLFDPGDPQGLLEASQRLLADRDGRDQLRRNARSEAERWGWAGATQQLRGYYGSVLAGVRSPDLALK
ncbi:MAG: glycosyltransferase, partial [Chitinophagia bacterium]|nr:glycosyltransferase [Chitinophagia bacterium]